MTTLRRRGLQIDDPLGPARSPGPTAAADEPAVTDRSDRTRHGRAAGATASDRPASAAPARKPPRRRPAAGAPRGGAAGAGAVRGEAAGDKGTEVWREWSGLTGVGSFRLPHELLAELSDTARELGLPIGLIVAAAITQLLDQPSEQIAALVDRADDARIHGRRRARRPLKQTER
jgi:hypothetical protein